MIKQAFLLIAVFGIAAVATSNVFGQVSEKEGPSQQEIEEQLKGLLGKIPAEKGELERQPESSPGTTPESAKKGIPSMEPSRPERTGNVVTDLEQEIEEISKTKRTKQSNAQRLKLVDLKKRLKIAKTIESQLAKTPLAKHKLNRGAKSNEDSFVIAQISVQAKSTTADISFLPLEGEANGTNELYDFLKSTPSGGYRDYRIIGRYRTSDLAQQATEFTRKEYDLQKERERQMIAYIQQRNQRMARIKASRRC